MRRTKAAQIYRKTGNLRAVQLLLGHTKLESTVRYLGIEVDDALAISEQVELLCHSGIWRPKAPCRKRPGHCTGFRSLAGSTIRVGWPKKLRCHSEIRSQGGAAPEAAPPPSRDSWSHDKPAASSKSWPSADCLTLITVAKGPRTG